MSRGSLSSSAGPAAGPDFGPHGEAHEQYLAEVLASDKPHEDAALGVRLAACPQCAAEHRALVGIAQRLAREGKWEQELLAEAKAPAQGKRAAFVREQESVVEQFVRARQAELQVGSQTLGPRRVFSLSRSCQRWRSAFSCST